MDLKSVVKQKLLDDVLRFKNLDKHKVTTKDGKQIQKWRVLVTDKLTVKIVSSCLNMHELCDYGVTLVEDIAKKREPLQMDAIYFITPSIESVRCLMRDYEFSKALLYQFAYVFFTAAIPNGIFEQLKKSKVIKYMKSCQEVNFSYIPYEEKVFTLDAPESFQNRYVEKLRLDREESMAAIAEQVTTLCVSLGECPSIRYRAIDSQNYNQELSEMIEKRLESYKKDEPEIGEGKEKENSTLLIIDRGFDCITPLLHELTLQAMAYDLLPIVNDVYEYQADNRVKEVILDEKHELWKKLRHDHIAIVPGKVKKEMMDFNNKKGKKDVINVEKPTVGNLGAMIKNIPMEQKKLSNFALNMNLVGECMTIYEEYMKDLCIVEQDLAMGETSSGDKVKELLPQSVVKILLNSHISNMDKVRILALSVMNMGGVSEDNFLKILRHAMIEEDQDIIRNLEQLGINIIRKPNAFRNQFKIPQRERNDNPYTTSRWTPLVKYIMEDAMDEKLDTKQYPYLTEPTKKSSHLVATSARFGNWNKSQAVVINRPRLIIFIIGGVTYSEMRCAYEAADKYKTWEVVLGSSHILTPEIFLSDLKSITESNFF